MIYRQGNKLLIECSNCGSYGDLMFGELNASHMGYFPPGTRGPAVARPFQATAFSPARPRRSTISIRQDIWLSCTRPA